MKKIITFIILVTLSFFSFAISKKIHTKIILAKDFSHIYHTQGFFSLGATRTKISNNPFIAITNDVTNTYVSNTHSSWGELMGVGLGTIYPLSHHIHLILGPAAYFIDLGRGKGLEHPFSNAGNFDTLDYRFFAQSYLLLLESRFIYTATQWQPFIVAGAGVAWNQLYDYEEEATDPGSSAAPALAVFRHHTMSNFAYELGFGVNHPLFVDKKRGILYGAALEYRHFNVGAGKLSPSLIETTNQTLQVGTFRVNSILLSLTAAFKD